MELMSNENFIKIAAGIGAAVLFFGPQIAKAIKSLMESLASLKIPSPLPADESDEVADMKLVLELAHRLRERGNSKAVELAQQLLDEMMAPTTSSKK